MDRTYDPIVAGPEPLTYLQLRTPASPRLGIAMVLVSAKGELMTVRSGSPVPPVRLGDIGASTTSTQPNINCSSRLSCPALIPVSYFRRASPTAVR